MENCLFCKIIKNEIPSERVYEDESVIAFKDIQPQAKTHLLFIHKTHTENFNELVKNEKALVALMKAIAKYTNDSGLVKSGYRLVSNVGKNAGQSVFHTHIHILSATKLSRFGE